MRTMIALGVALTACSGPQDSPTTDGMATAPPLPTPTVTATASPTPTVEASATASAAPTTTTTAGPTTSSAPGRKLSKEGEICGGIGGFRCDEGLVCRMSQPAYPDQAGKCQRPSTADGAAGKGAPSARPSK